MALLLPGTCSVGAAMEELLAARDRLLRWQKSSRANAVTPGPFTGLGALIKSCKTHVAILAANVRDISRKASVLVPGQKLRGIPAQTFSHSPSSDCGTVNLSPTKQGR